MDEFRDWRSAMLGVYGSPNAMVIEIGCNGPIEWTKNAPILRIQAGGVNSFTLNIWSKHYCWTFVGFPL